MIDHVVEVRSRAPLNAPGEIDHVIQRPCSRMLHIYSRTRMPIRVLLILRVLILLRLLLLILALVFVQWMKTHDGEYHLYLYLQFYSYLYS